MRYSIETTNPPYRIHEPASQWLRVVSDNENQSFSHHADVFEIIEHGANGTRTKIGHINVYPARSLSSFGWDRLAVRGVDVDSENDISPRSRRTIRNLLLQSKDIPKAIRWNWQYKKQFRRNLDDIFAAARM
jgi:hypothetical protein